VVKKSRQKHATLLKARGAELGRRTSGRFQQRDNPTTISRENVTDVGAHVLVFVR
jgi:hypothetical protein